MPGKDDYINTLRSIVATLENPGFGIEAGKINDLLKYTRMQFKTAA